MIFSWLKENLFFKAKSKKFGHVCENSLYYNRLKLEWPKTFIFIVSLAARYEQTKNECDF